MNAQHMENVKKKTLKMLTVEVWKHSLQNRVGPPLSGGTLASRLFIP